MINEHCPSCGAPGGTIVYDVSRPVAHAHVGLPGLIRKCIHCNLLFKSFDTIPKDIYNEQYASSFKEIEDYSGTHAVDFFRKILDYSTVRLRKEGFRPRLLDIGSGVGIMLETARYSGFDATGVELSETLAKEAEQKGFTIINKDVADISIEEQFDVITMMDIIEHLEHPKNVLTTLKALLGRKGELIVYTPDHSSLIVRIADWFYRLGIKSPVENIFACTHTCFFTTETLKNILTQSGYIITEVHHYSYDTSRPGQKISMIAKIAINAIEGLGNLLGFNGFRVVIYAQPVK